MAGLVITMGTLGDRIGRRRLLLAGAAAFAVLSVMAAFAASPLMLIVTRALLGVAGATLAPSTLALITSMFRGERERGKAIALWATCQFAGGALGTAPLVPAVALVVGAAVGVVFARRQLQVKTPLLDLRLLRRRPLVAVLIALVFAGIAMAGAGLLVTQYLQDVLGYTPTLSAVLFAPMGLGVAAGTMAAPALAGRVRQPAAIAGGRAGRPDLDPDHAPGNPARPGRASRLRGDSLITLREPARTWLERRMMA